MDKEYIYNGRKATTRITTKILKEAFDENVQLPVRTSLQLEINGELLPEMYDDVLLKRETGSRNICLLNFQHSLVTGLARVGMRRINASTIALILRTPEHASSSAGTKPAAGPRSRKSKIGKTSTVTRESEEPAAALHVLADSVTEAEDGSGFAMFSFGAGQHSNGDATDTLQHGQWKSKRARLGTPCDGDELLPSLGGPAPTKEATAIPSSSLQGQQSPSAAAFRVSTASTSTAAAGLLDGPSFSYQADQADLLDGQSLQYDASGLPNSLLDLQGPQSWLLSGQPPHTLDSLVAAAAAVEAGTRGTEADPVMDLPMSALLNLP